MQLEYFFDFSCPYAYLGSTQIESVAAAAGATLQWRPMLLGGVFRAVNTPQNMGAGMPPDKARHNLLDMHRWAALWQVPLVMPATHPMRTVAALRALLALPADRWPPLIHAIYASYWIRGENIADPAVLRSCLERAQITGAPLESALAANDDPDIKADLRARTDEAVERGVFGAPAMFIHDDDGTTSSLYWGQDRLDMVARALGNGAARPEPASDSSSSSIDFYYDFSSPFAYLASTQIEAVAARAGATLRWKPFLLGALFKSIGTPDVPILAFSDAKRRYTRVDLHRWADQANTPFSFTTRFPVRTVTALRLALLAGDRIGPLSHAIYRAIWVQDRDITDDEVLADIAETCGLDRDLVAATREPANKRLLFAANEEALSRGVFGAPTSIVSGPDHDDELFWGQDRLALVERAASGWHPALAI